MMNQIWMVWMILSFFLGYTSFPEIEVVVEHITKEKGTLKVCIYQDGESFLKKPLECKEERVEQAGAITIIFSGLTAENYAIYVFQDLNGNDSLDRNFFKVPKEPYGFSNNPDTKLGPPAFSETKFEASRVKKLKIILK